MPAVRERRLPLESALLDVQATLAELLDAADEQHAAIAASDRAGLELITDRQERLAVRLEKAERARLSALHGVTLGEAIGDMPIDDSIRLTELAAAIADLVRELRVRQARTQGLLERSIEVTGQTIHFLQRLVTVHTQGYGARSAPQTPKSMLVDTRA